MWQRARRQVSNTETQHDRRECPTSNLWMPDLLDDWAACNQPASGRRSQTVSYAAPLSRRPPNSCSQPRIVKPGALRKRPRKSCGKSLRGQGGRKPAVVTAGGVKSRKESLTERAARLNAARGSGPGSRRKVPLLPPGWVVSTRPHGAPCARDCACLRRLGAEPWWAPRPSPRYLVYVFFILVL